MKQEIDNNAMWAAFRQELALQGELHVIAAIDNALNNLGFTIKETSTIIPIPLEQGEHLNFLSKIQVGDKVTRNEDGVLVNLSQLNRVAKKRGEQKPLSKFEVGDIMRTLQEATDNITDGMPVVVSIDEEYYHCTNELIAIKDQDKYEYPPMNRRQKPAWSEEDEESLLDLIKFIENWKAKGKDFTSKLALWTSNEQKCDRLLTFLKSLRPQNTWQPSKEQIKVLQELCKYSEVANLTEKGVEILKSMYNDIKKLREE